MRFFKYLCALFVIGIVAACGGGGGSAGTPSGTSNPIVSSSGGAITLAVGVTQNYTITGGRAPFQISSSNTQVAVAGMQGSGFWVTGVATSAETSTATLTISDAAQNSTTVTVTVANLTALYTTAPTTFVIAKGSQRIFKVGGGVPGYSVESTDPRIATIALDGSGSNMTITGIAAGSTSLQIRDAAGKVLSLGVTVGGSSAEGLFTEAPTDLTMVKGQSLSFAVGGGVTPYRLVSNDSRIATVALNATRTAMTITGVAPGTTTLTLTDSGNPVSSIAIRVTVGGSSPVPFFTTAPGDLTIVKDTERKFVIGGGVADYTVSSQDARVATVSLDAAGTGLTIKGVAIGKTILTLRDSGNPTAEKTINVTVGGSSPLPLFTNAPASLTIAYGGSAGPFTVTGGVEPYSIISDNTLVAKVSGGGSGFTITAGNTGTANVTIKDAAGTSAPAISVTVGTSTKLFISAPGSVTLAAGTTSTYVVGGGSLPYVGASSSDTRVATASLAGTTLTVSAKASGTAKVLVTDSAGNTASLDVTVGSTGTVVSQDPVFKSAALTDSTGSATSSISASGYTTLNVKLTDPSGNGLANQLVTVSGDATQVSFPESGSGLTNASGVATIKVTRASLTASGAGSLTITYNYKAGTFATWPDGSTPPSADKVINTYVGYQLATTNITLTNLNVGAATLPAYGTRQITVQANINGVAATTPIVVNFSATCGQIAPATVSTNSSGIATVSYTANETTNPTGCSGKSVEISASSTGAPVLTKTLTITAAAATSISFVDAKPARIYLANSGGPTQSVLRFKLIDAQGTALASQDVLLTLKTLNGGIPKASFGTVGNVAPITTTTDADGFVSVPVFSGTVPTSVLVNAALVSNALVQSDSAMLTIASGRPAQARVSLSVGQLAIRGFDFDGGTTSFTMSLADRQGNPVPKDTPVNFVTEGGVIIPPVCTTGDGDSQCTVQIRSQNPRPSNGLVSVLAYTPGEEDFVDSNFNNVYDCGEAWTDLGTAYRDDTATSNGVINPFVTGEFSVPRSASASTCATGVPPSPQAGDGVWGAVDVRKQMVIVFSTDDFKVVSPVWTSALDSTWSTTVTTALSVLISDMNGNSVPTASPIKAEAIDNTPKTPSYTVGTTTFVGNCSVTGQSQTEVPNTLEALPFAVYLKECVAGDQVKVTVTTPGMNKSVVFSVP